MSANLVCHDKTCEIFKFCCFMCARSFRARHLIKGTKELSFKHIKRSTNVCEQAENWDRDFWQMNCCSHICKKKLCHLKCPTSPERGPHPILICCLAKILLAFHPILPFLEYFRKSLWTFFLFKAVPCSCQICHLYRTDHCLALPVR